MNLLRYWARIGCKRSDVSE